MADILAFDPGKVTGWAMSGGTSGHFKFDQIDHGERLYRWTDRVAGMLADLMPELVIWDQPFARGAEGALTVALGKYLEMECWDRGIERLIVPMNSVKKTVLGNARATNTDVLAWAEREGWTVANHHEADAVALLQYARDDRRAA